MEKKKNTPKLRFPEFTGDWEEKKICDVSSYVDYRGKTPSKSDSGVFLVTAKNIKQGYIDYDISKEYIPNEIYEDAMRRGKPKLGDVLITTEAPLGNVASIDKENIALAQRVIKLRGKNGLMQNLFLKHRLISPQFQNEIDKKGTGTTAKGIKGSELHQIVISFPICSEQTKIATFLTAVDEKLTQLKKKKTLLEQYKKGVMQKLFSQELRFKDDNNQDFPDWQEKTLGDVGEFIGGGTPSTKNNEYWNGNIPWISSSDLTEESIVSINMTRFISEEAVLQSATKLVPVNSVLIVSRVGVGKVAVSNLPLCTSQDFTNLVPLNQNSIFLAYLIKLKTDNLLGFNQGTSIKGFVKSDLESLKLLIPTLPEQVKIANFLSSIDEKICQCRAKIEKMEAWKKGLLQQMFC